MYRRLKQLMLWLGDTGLFFIGLYIALYVRFGARPEESHIASLFAPLAILFLLATIIYFIVGLYDIGRARNTREFYQKILLSASVWLVLAIVFFYGNPATRVSPKSILLLTTLFSFGLSALWRAVYNGFLSKALLKTTVVFVGHRGEVDELIDLIKAQPERGYAVLGLIDGGDPSVGEVPTAPSMRALLTEHRLPRPDLIVLSPEVSAEGAAVKELYQMLFKQVSMISLAAFYEQQLRRVPPFTFSESWFISNLNEQARQAYDRFRVLIDCLIALTMAGLFALTLPLVALAIKLTSRGPVFFRQERVGRLGRVFTLYKYRTMRSIGPGGSAEVAGPEYASVGDKRITPVGKILRAVRLDELPQCLNILKGDMALIGPRPERPEFVGKLTETMPFYSLRHLIKPGLTGWAQLQKSYYGTIEENLKKLEYDLYYIKNRGPILDLAILLRTINILLRFMGR